MVLIIGLLLILGMILEEIKEPLKLLLENVALIMIAMQD